MSNSFLDKMKIDAIGEIQNISMGSAASAVSNMIDSSVTFVPHTVSVLNANEIFSLYIEPDKKYLYVKIQYTNGITGSSLLILNQDDMQVIVKKMMGMPMEVEKEFVFDEMYLSGVSEIMNQMMGAAVTTLSQMLADTISIAPPETSVPQDKEELLSILGISAENPVCAAEFDFNIDSISNNRFVIILSEELANSMVNKMISSNPDMFSASEATSSGSSDSLIDNFKIDAVGEFENIAMGASATALSKFLDSKVTITTPRVSVDKASAFTFDEFEPSVSARIDYIQGINGASVLVLKQNDVQLMINKLMGLPLEISDDFEFDEMNISAVCEIMNQMMGAAATALSELTNMVVDISPPHANIIDKKEQILEIIDINASDDVCAISFDLSIDNIINSHFITMLSIDLANDIANKMLMSYSNALENCSTAVNAEPEQKPVHKVPALSKQPETAAKPVPKPVPKLNPKPVPKPNVTPVSKTASHQNIHNSQPSATVTNTANVNVQNYHMNSFGGESDFLTSKQYDNLRSLMNVPMDVAIRIGTTEKRMDEILEFTKGTIIELDTLANEPVDVVVNGNLIAKGDVVVVDDNFAIRITEIINNNILNTLN